VCISGGVLVSLELDLGFSSSLVVCDDGVVRVMVGVRVSLLGEPLVPSNLSRKQTV